MKKELQDQLHKDYPRIFAKKTSVDVGDGWFNIVNYICQLMELHLDWLPLEERDQVYVLQIKEKFGLLRIYVNHEEPYFSGLVDLGEAISEGTCEKCGMPGQRRFGQWIKALCNSCFVPKE